MHLHTSKSVRKDLAIHMSHGLVNHILKHASDHSDLYLLNVAFLEAVLQHQEVDSHSIVVTGKKNESPSFSVGIKLKSMKIYCFSFIKKPVPSSPIPLFSVPVPAVPLTSKPWMSQTWMTESPKEATSFGQTSLTPAVR